MVEISRGPRYRRHTIAVFIDERRGAVAKHIGLLEPIDQIQAREHGRDGGRELPEVSIEYAAQRIRTALERTDRRLSPPLGEGVVEHRALALARIRPYGHETNVAGVA